MYLRVMAVYILYTNSMHLAGDKCHVPGLFSTARVF